MANYVHVIFWSLAGGVLSLAGGILLLGGKKSAKKLAEYATPFAAGALLAAAFLELFPEAIELVGASSGARWALFGLLLFFILEHFIHFFHHNHRHDDKHNAAVAPLIIVGDSVHNFIDGIAIGAAFLINVPAGIITAIAVAAHEIPQEIGDFGLLLKHGFKKAKVIQINILSALMSTVGAVLTFWVGSRVELPLGALLAVAAGMFIYIAASDLIPEIHHGAFKTLPRHFAAGLLLFGVLVVGTATNIAHTYLEENDAGHAHSLQHEETASEHYEEVHDEHDTDDEHLYEDHGHEEPR